MTLPKDPQKIELAKKRMSIVRKGKTWEEIFGKEKAKELKMKKTIWFKANNPGRKPSTETKKRMSISAKKRCAEDRGSFFREGNTLSPESRLKLSQSRRKWCLEHRDQFIERGLRCVEIRSKKGYFSKEESIIKQLLPIDFLHNIRLKNTVPDFHSKKRKIVIEVDGSSHSGNLVNKLDKKHNRLWKSIGYQIFRVTNKDVNEYMKPLLEGNLNAI